MNTEIQRLEKKSSPTVGRVLVVDDEPFIVGAFGRMLAASGFEVKGVANGRLALEELAANRYEAVVSDILMPGMDGMALLRAIRERDLDLPVIVLTGSPTLDTAMKAVELGALRYLTKPVDPEELEKAVRRAVGLRRLADARRQVTATAEGHRAMASDRAGLESTFERALQGMWLAYQPVVRFSRGEVWGWEALVRSTEPQLANPAALLDAATRLNALPKLGRAIRRRAAAAILRAPETGSLLVNLHPLDLLDADLFDPTAPLSVLANRVILEVTERSSLDEIDDLHGRAETLKRLGFRIAIDDVGAGYSGLGSFVRLDPNVAKLDMMFVRNIHEDATKQQLVRTLAGLCHELYVDVIAEGVETEDERNCVVDLGCDLLQGYLYGKPDRTFKTSV